MYVEFPAAFTFDLAGVGFTLKDVGRKLSWVEAAWLVAEFQARPDTALGAAAGGMDYPITRADATLRDFIDLFISANSTKRRSGKYPRPFKTSAPESGSRLGDTKRMSQDQVRSHLTASAPTRTIGGET